MKCTRLGLVQIGRWGKRARVMGMDDESMGVAPQCGMQLRLWIPSGAEQHQKKKINPCIGSLAVVAILDIRLTSGDSGGYGLANGFSHCYSIEQVIIDL